MRALSVLAWNCRGTALSVMPSATLLVRERRAERAGIAQPQRLFSVFFQALVEETSFVSIELATDCEPDVLELPLVHSRDPGEL